MPRDKRPANASLYVRNLDYRTRADDLRHIFDKYGHVKDVYIPTDYYTKKPRGFAYVQFEDIRDAEDALYYEERAHLHGRDLEVQFAEGERKPATVMRSQDSGGYGNGGGRRRSRSPPRRRSRSPPRRPRRSRSRSRSPPRRRQRSRSRSGGKRRSVRRSNSPRRRSRSPSVKKSASRSPSVKRSRSRSPSVKRSRSPTPRSRSPTPKSRSRSRSNEN